MSEAYYLLEVYVNVSVSEGIHGTAKGY